jgi:preprotein translocase subunit SecA
VQKLKGENVYAELMANPNPGLSDMKGLSLIECTKKEAYACDITVGVNNEFGFDYLRDNMATTANQLVQRELYFCVVDEADSILIDEARTPLIISALPEDSDVEMYTKFAKIARKLEEEVDFTVDHKSRSVMLTEAGLEKAEKALNIEDVWSDFTLVHHLENAVKAKALFHIDDHYIVRDGEVLIVDSFTGRVLPGRRFSEGMHQAIEAKEGVAIQQENRTMATITFQNYFRLYKILAGGSGTVLTEAEEFYKIYTLESVVIPTNKPVIREDKPDFIYRNEEVKFKAVAEEVKERSAKGQPVLIGTTSVAKSEKLSQLLDQLGVTHEVLNAKYHEREAHIVAKAGQKGAVTVATNMAGRGTDIPLTVEVKEVGGLAVIGTERHEARRIDNQLRGRSGRQGDPGYTRFYVSLEDQIMKVMAGEMLQRTVGRMMLDDMPIQNSLITRQIESAQKRIEGVNFDIRKTLVDYDDVLNKHREVFYSRRRQILELTDKSLGIYPGSENNLDVQQAALAALEQKMLDTYVEEVDALVTANVAGGGKLNNEADLSTLVAQILDLAEDTAVADAWDISRDLDLTAELKNRYRGQKFEFIKEDITSKVMQMVQAKFAEMGADFAQIAKAIMLEAMNRQWMDHLETMDDIRAGINLHGYAQRDPLVEYKTVGYQKFIELLNNINAQIARQFLRLTKTNSIASGPSLQLATNEDQISDILTGDRELLPDLANIGSTGDGQLDKLLQRANTKLEAERQAAMLAGIEPKAFVRSTTKVGRNDPCPCGSGKKYKNCGLLNTAEHQKLMAGKEA